MYSTTESTDYTESSGQLDSLNSIEIERDEISLLNRTIGTIWIHYK